LIESKEMSSIVDELVSAIGLQRFRFTERQNNGTCVPLCENGSSMLIRPLAKSL
jgi:hypothetical protein